MTANTRAGIMGYEKNDRPAKAGLIYTKTRFG